MKDNITKVLDRGEKLESLEEKSGMWHICELLSTILSAAGLSTLRFEWVFEIHQPTDGTGHSLIREATCV